MRYTNNFGNNFGLDTVQEDVILYFHVPAFLSDPYFVASLSRILWEDYILSYFM